MKRIGILTSGGDCPGLNAVLRGVVRAASNLDWEVIGFHDGFEGLLPEGGDSMALTRANTAGIMHLGGTMLGTTSKGHFITKVGDGSNRSHVPPAVLEQTKRTLAALRIDVLICIGGAPTTLDRILGTRFGVHAVEMIAAGKLGEMVSYQNYEVGSVPIADAVHRIKLVLPDCQMVQTCRAVGISFGD